MRALLLFLFLISCENPPSFHTQIYIVGGTSIVYGEKEIPHKDTTFMMVEFGSRIDVICENVREVKVYSLSPYRVYRNKGLSERIFTTHIN
jgi:hypothetical protein